ncbi:MAG: hypothetical protein AAFQ21_05585 [Pseudomonadota bacterium]
MNDRLAQSAGGTGPSPSPVWPEMMEREGQIQSASRAPDRIA